MQENKALVLAFASLIGIFLIGAISGELELPETKICSISADSLNLPVRTRGIIKGYSKFGGGIKVLLEEDDCKLQVTYFTKEDLRLKKGLCAEATGEISRYRLALQLEAKRIDLFVC